MIAHVNHITIQINHIIMAAHVKHDTIQAVHMIMVAHVNLAVNQIVHMIMAVLANHAVILMNQKSNVTAIDHLTIQMIDVPVVIQNT